MKPVIALPFRHQAGLVLQPEIHPSCVITQMDTDGVFRSEQLPCILSGLQYFQSVQMIGAKKMLQILSVRKTVQIFTAGGDIHNMPHGIAFFLRSLYLRRRPAVKNR